MNAQRKIFIITEIIYYASIWRILNKISSKMLKSILNGTKWADWMICVTCCIDTLILSAILKTNENFYWYYPNWLWFIKNKKNIDFKLVYNF